VWELPGSFAGIRFILEKGIEQIRKHEMGLIERLIDGLKEFPQVRLYGPENGQGRTATLSFNIVRLSSVGGGFPFRKGIRDTLQTGDSMCTCGPSHNRDIP